MNAQKHIVLIYGSTFFEYEFISTTKSLNSFGVCPRLGGLNFLSFSKILNYFQSRKLIISYTVIVMHHSQLQREHGSYSESATWTCHAPLRPYIIYILPSSNETLQEECYMFQVPLSESALSSLFLAPR